VKVCGSGPNILQGRVHLTKYRQKRGNSDFFEL
jgi:hypothetical protein